jgi:hypothetical protein
MRSPRRMSLDLAGALAHVDRCADARDLQPCIERRCAARLDDHFLEFHGSKTGGFDFQIVAARGEIRKNVETIGVAGSLAGDALGLIDDNDTGIGHDRFVRVAEMPLIMPVGTWAGAITAAAARSIETVKNLPAIRSISQSLRSH